MITLLQLAIIGLVLGRYCTFVGAFSKSLWWTTLSGMMLMFYAFTQGDAVVVMGTMILFGLDFYSLFYLLRH